MLSLLLLLPSALLFLTALGIVILRQYRPGIGYAWLAAVIGGILSAAAAAFLRWRLPTTLEVGWLRAFGELSSPPSFRMDYISWPYTLSLAVLALAFVLTDAARLETEARPFNWAGGLAITGLGILAVMAANPVTLVVAWTAVDLVELLMILSTPTGQRMGGQVVRAFMVRVSGTLLVVLSTLLAASRAIPFDLAEIPQPLAIYMLLAAGLRLGVLPLNVPYTREVYAWRGLGNIMRLIGPASSLVVLGRMPTQVVPPGWQGLLLGLSALAAIYGAGVWLTTRDELNGRPFWSTSLAALGVASVISGSPQSSVAWGCALILTGSVLFFYSARRRQIAFLPLLAVLGITGLPFTPASAGWQGISGSSANLFTPLFFLAVIFLIWGYFRHLMRPREELYRMERWVHAVYPVGLGLLILAQWAIGIRGWPGSFTAGVWGMSIGAALLAGLGLILFRNYQQRLVSDAPSERWLGVFARRLGHFLNAILSLNWLYSLINGLYRLVQNIIQLLTAMFEGDGGVLWSLVMLALLVSLITTSGAGPASTGLPGAVP